MRGECVAALCLRRHSCSRFQWAAHRLVAGPARGTGRAGARLPRAPRCPMGGGGWASPGRWPSSRRLIAWVSRSFCLWRFQPAGAGTCASTERDRLGSPTCKCHYARLLARAARQHERGTHRRSPSLATPGTCSARPASLRAAGAGTYRAAPLPRVRIPRALLILVPAESLR